MKGDLGMFEFSRSEYEFAFTLYDCFAISKIKETITRENSVIDQLDRKSVV